MGLLSCEVGGNPTCLVVIQDIFSKLPKVLVACPLCTRVLCCPSGILLQLALFAHKIKEVPD